MKQNKKTEWDVNRNEDKDEMRSQMKSGAR